MIKTVAKTFTGGIVREGAIVAVNKLFQRKIKTSKASVLCPGDYPPEVETYQDVQDYRGIALENELPKTLTKKRKDSLGLGTYVYPCGGNRQSALYLTDDILQRHVAVFGSTGSGKTNSIIIPWVDKIVKQGNSIVLLDVMGEFRDILEKAASKAGCRIWHWSNIDVDDSDVWNWFDEIDLKDRDCDKYVNSLVDSILGENKNESQPFFHERYKRWLKAAIFVLKETQPKQAKPSELYKIITDQQRLAKAANLTSYSTDLNDLINSNDYSTLCTGLLNPLYFFRTDRVKNICETTKDNWKRQKINLSDFTSRPTLFIIGASLEGGEESKVLSGIAFKLISEKLFSRFRQTNLQQNVRKFSTNKTSLLYFIVDEAPRLQDRIDFDMLLSVLRHANVRMCLAAQDVGQITDKNNKEKDIFANCNTLIIMRGCSSSTAEYFSKRLGERMAHFVDTAYESGFGYISNKNKSVRSEKVPVLSEREIMHPPESCGKYCAVVKIPDQPKPFLVDLKRTIK